MRKNSKLAKAIFILVLIGTIILAILHINTQSSNTKPTKPQTSRRFGGQGKPPKQRRRVIKKCRKKSKHKTCADKKGKEKQ